MAPRTCGRVTSRSAGGREPRFADTRFDRKEPTCPETVLPTAPAVASSIFLSTKRGRQAVARSASKRLFAELARSLPSLHRPGDALSPRPHRVLHSKRLPEVSRALGADNRVRLCDTCSVPLGSRLANDCWFLSRTRHDQVSPTTRPWQCRYALQGHAWSSSRRLQHTSRPARTTRSASFLGLGVAEIHQHPVAHVLLGSREVMARISDALW